MCLSVCPYKCSPLSSFCFRGSHESIRQSQQCITALQRDPNCDLLQLLQVKAQTNSSSRPLSAAETAYNPNFATTDSLEPSSWKVAGKLTNVSSKSRSSQSVPDMANNSNSSLSSKQQQQSSSMLKMSRSAAAVERKGSLSSSGGGAVDRVVTCRSGGSGISVTSVSAVFSTATWVHSNTHQSSSFTSSSNTGPLPKSGAVRQLFTSNAASHQLTSTNSVLGVKMSTTSSLHGSKPSQNSANVPSTTSWKQMSAGVTPPAIGKVPLPSTGEDVPLGRQHQHQTGNRTLPVGDKSSFQVSSSVLLNAATTVGVCRENTQNVFEQILKTPSLFAEVASQITQPKKYSDAVGKKPSTGLSDGQTHVSSKPMTSISSNQPLNTHLINKAPGAKPIGMDHQVNKVPFVSTAQRLYVRICVGVVYSATSSYFSVVRNSFSYQY